MADGTIRLGWEVDLANLRDQLRASGAVQEKEVKKLVSSLRQQFGKAAKDSEKAAKDSEKAWSDVGKKIAGYVGGPVAQLGDALYELVPKAGAASASLGTLAAGVVGVGGLAVAVGAVGAAFVGVAEAAKQAEDRLVESGHAASIPREARQSLERYREATSTLSTASDLLVVRLGAMAAEGLTPVATAALGAVTVLDRFSGSMSHAVAVAADTWKATARVSAAIATLGASEVWIRGVGAAYGYLADEGARAAEALKKTGESTEWLDHLMSEVEAEEQRRRDNAKRGEELLAQRRAEAIAAAKEQARAEAALSDSWAAARAELAKVAGQMDDVVDAATIAGRESRDAGLATYRAWRDAREEFDRNLDTLRGYQSALDATTQGWAGAGLQAQAYGAAVSSVIESDAVVATLGSVMSLFDGLAEANQRAADGFADWRTELRSGQAEAERADLARIDRLEQIGQLTADEADAQRAAADARWKADKAFRRQVERAEREGILRSWKRNRALQILGALAEGARSAVALVPAFAGLGPFAPAAAAAVAALPTATAIATIKAQKPPELPTGRTPYAGGSPDHTETVAVRPDEVMLSPRGSDAYREAEWANRGQGLGGTTIQLAIDGRVVDTRVDAALDRRTRLLPPGHYAAGKRAIYGSRY